MIYFIDKPERFAKFFVACLAFATVSLAMELQTRKEPDPRRAFWVIPNMIYAILAMWLSSPSYAIWAALGVD
jgi:hypothetical protein